MEPRIQYAKTSDGVNIAYAMLGEGPLMVWPPVVWGDLHMYSAATAFVPTMGFLFSKLDAFAERGWRVIIHDGRGSGSSQRDVADISLEGRVRDLEAVTNAAGAERFVLVGGYAAGPTAINYLVGHPERVTRLVLVNTFARGADYFDTMPAVRVGRDMGHIAEDQWEFYSVSLANALLGFSDSNAARQLAAAFRAAMTPKALMFMLPLSLVRLEWQIPEWRNRAELLAAKRQLIRYDGKGKCGTAAPRWWTRQRVNARYRVSPTIANSPLLNRTQGRSGLLLTVP